MSSAKSNLKPLPQKYKILYIFIHFDNTNLLNKVKIQSKNPSIGGMVKNPGVFDQKLFMDGNIIYCLDDTCKTWSFELNRHGLFGNLVQDKVLKALNVENNEHSADVRVNLHDVVSSKTGEIFSNATIKPPAVVGTVFKPLVLIKRSDLNVPVTKYEDPHLKFQKEDNFVSWCESESDDDENTV